MRFAGVVVVGAAAALTGVLDNDIGNVAAGAADLFAGAGDAIGGLFGSAGDALGNIEYVLCHERVFVLSRCQFGGTTALYIYVLLHMYKMRFPPLAPNCKVAVGSIEHDPEL